MQHNEISWRGKRVRCPVVPFQLCHFTLPAVLQLTGAWPDQSISQCLTDALVLGVSICKYLLWSRHKPLGWLLWILGKAWVCQSSVVNLAFGDGLDSSHSGCLQLPGKLEERGNPAQQGFDKHRASETLSPSPEGKERCDKLAKLKIVEHILWNWTRRHVCQRSAYIEVFMAILLYCRDCVIYSKIICIHESMSITCSQMTEAGAGAGKRSVRRATTLECLLFGEKGLRETDRSSEEKTCFNSEPAWLTLWNICQNWAEIREAGRDLHSKKGLQQQDLKKRKAKQSRWWCLRESWAIHKWSDRLQLSNLSGRWMHGPRGGRSFTSAVLYGSLELVKQDISLQSVSTTEVSKSLQSGEYTPTPSCKINIEKTSLD